ncbi:MAG: hypothetical protein RBR38_16645 [Desulfomicrobium apsheronum]|nr:hypothetical protein [Desulfomicrobium apsheronum]
MRIKVRGRVELENLQTVVTALVQRFATQLEAEYEVEDEIFITGLNVYFDMVDSTGELIELEEGATTRHAFTELTLPNRERTTLPKKKPKAALRMV